MEPKGTVLPVYFVADESGSMGPYIGELNSGLNSLLAALQVESFAAAKVRFSIIGFADDARTYLPPTDLRSLTGLPVLQARGLTSYQAAFDQLGYRLSVDIPDLKSQGYMVNRPAAFFLSDGAPNGDEDWQAARNYLLSQPYRPNILAFGIGQADPSVILSVATDGQYAFMSDRGVDTGTALTEFIKSLTQSVISSGQAIASGTQSLQMERPASFSLAMDLV